MDLGARLHGLLKMRPPSRPLLNTFAFLLAHDTVQRKEFCMPSIVFCPHAKYKLSVFWVLFVAEEFGPPYDWVIVQS